jgi:amino acid transporter
MILRYMHLAPTALREAIGLLDSGHHLGNGQNAITEPSELTGVFSGEGGIRTPRAALANRQAVRGLASLAGSGEAPFDGLDRSTRSAREVKPHRTLTTLPLVAATYFMVAGGPYGLEEVVHRAGVRGSVLVLFITPFIWSLPTSLMVAELGAALPDEGGYYAWVKRALGPFWAFQEAWLSLAASVFDMAIYPTIFIAYLGRVWPAATAHPFLVGGAMIAVCVGVNLRGVKSVGGASELFTVALLLPFAIFMVLAPFRREGAPPPQPAGGSDLLGAVLVAMWNTMGWDNSSTIADEVHDPQRTYPRAMFGAVILVTLTYALPIVAVGAAGLDTSGWDTGAWVDAAGVVGGRWLGSLVVIGGMLCGIGMFNALLLSYSRVPVALADDGYLPKVFARRTHRSEAPWVSLVACAVAWTAMLGLSFERLFALDILLYGSSLMLEFVALVALRVRSPELARPFRVPGGTAGAAALGVGPLLLLSLALLKNDEEPVGGVNGLVVGLAVIATGPLLYLAVRGRARRVPACG